MAETLEKPTSRHRLRLSLRGMILLVLVIGGLLGWSARSVRVQQDAVATIKRNGGNVGYDWEQTWNEDSKTYAEPFWRQWSADHFGLDFVAHPESVSLRPTSTLNLGETLVAVGSLPGLTRLWISAVDVEDADLAPLKNLNRLKELSIKSKSAGDQGISALRGLTDLEALYLGGTDVGDAGMAYLTDLVKLRYLDLRGTKVGNAGLKQLSRLTELQNLMLDDTLVTDDGMAHLKRLTRLRTLYLKSDKITDAGLEHLQGLTDLQELVLMDTEVTDAGLMHLKDLKNLQFIHTSGQFTQSGIAEFQKSQPKVLIMGN